MEKRTSFIFYSEWWEHIEMLPDGEALSVIRAIFLYQRNETVPSLAGAAAMAFSFIRAQLDRDAEQWERVRQARADAGRTGGLKTQRSNRELKQTEANAFLLKQAEANQAVNVNEDGNVNVNVNGIKADKPPKRKRFSPPAADREFCADERLNSAVAAFVDFRKKTKRPMTEHAVDLLLSNLDKLSQSTEEKVEILNQSIVNGWTGVYPLKNSKPDVRQDLDDPLPY